MIGACLSLNSSLELRARGPGGGVEFDWWGTRDYSGIRWWGNRDSICTLFRHSIVAAAHASGTVDSRPLMEGGGAWGQLGMGGTQVKTGQPPNFSRPCCGIADCTGWHSGRGVYVAALLTA